MRHLAEKLLYIGRGEYDRMKPLTEGMRGMIEYVSPMVDERLAKPGDDFISVLASGEKRGIFTRHQVLVNTSLLLLAGHETTINLLCNGVLAFLRHPDQWEKYKQDPEGLAKSATEECLRYDAPVKSIQRIATQDVEMRGKVVKKQDRVRWFISSANRDPEQFPDPTRSTSRGIPTSTSPSARAPIIASGRRSHASRARRCSRRWPSDSRTFERRPTSCRTSRASPSAR